MTVPSFRNINLQAYKPGKSITKKKEKVIKLSANESALGISNRAKKALKTFNSNISKYPDGKFKELTSLISKKYNCDQNKIICGSGSDEIIQMLCQLFLNKADITFELFHQTQTRILFYFDHNYIFLKLYE